MEMDGMRAGPSSQDAPGPSDGDLRSSDDEYSEYSRHHPSFSNKPYSPPPLSDEEEEMDLGQQMEHVFARPRSPFVPPSRRKDAPLASILDPTLDGLDPRRFFPEFNSDKVLRFSRLFANNIKSSSKAQIWWLSETFHSKPPSAEERADKAKRRHSHRGSLALSFGPAATEEELMEDQEKQLLTLEATDHGPKKKVQLSDVAQPWRFGPAKMWYDQLGVPPLATSCTYGEEVDAKSELCAVEVADDEPIPADTFLPLNLVQWEDDIVYDGEEMRDKLIKELKSRDGVPYGGWIPTQTLRTYEAFQTARESGQLEGILSQRPGSNPSQQTIVEPTGVSMEPSCSFSLFPNESSDVISAPWEDDVVWGDEDIAHNSQPKVLTIDLFDDPVLFGMPEDRAMDEFDPNDPKKESQYTKKSKMILGQVAQRQKQEEEEQMESSVAQLTDKDPFNLSLDDYYTPKTINKSGNAVSSLIQHSIPSQNIHRCFFPTHMTPFKLRHWHRMPLSKRILKQIGGRYIHILGLNRHIRKIAEQRERAKAAEGGGDIFLMREVSDISGRDGELLLVEYSEEHPILLSQPGMASRIRNYHKRRTPKDPDPTMDFGELAFTHNSPFLGQLSAGQTLQSIENNLYRAPIHRHAAPSTHFLLIRSKQGYFIRRCPALFLAGQQSPLYEVPSPNSKRATVFVRDFLMAFIYRLFWASNDTPRRLKIEDIKAAFPHYAESSVRKRLKVCSDFKRMGTGMEQNYWVLRSDFRLPSKEEVLAMVTPEMCCAQYSMLAAEQRLKDAGYGENYFFTPEEGDDEEDEVRIEDEIKCAPWNTSRAFVAALRGKCVLDQTGIADPSGCGHGFSYVRVSSKPQKEDIPQVPKRLVTGTNADLRKLPLKEAKEICRDYGVKEEEISALSRWEIIDVIRTLSTQAAKAKNEASGEKSLTGMARFARGNFRFNMADMQDKYKKHCQHVFDLQNSVLANPEELSTDEGSSGEESDNEELANRLESMLSAAKGKKTISAGEKERMEKEDEERERRDLKRMLHGENIKGGKEEKGKEATEQDRKNAENIGKDVADAASKLAGITANQKLKIFRTYRNPDGTESTRTEVITRPQLIEAYARIRMTKDDTFIQVYAQMDEQFKEERRKEKRRLQDQLRRVKKNMERVTNRTPQADKKPKPFNPNLAKMRCSACGGTGHMKTNKNCPLWRGRRGGAEGGGGGDSVNVAMTDEEYSSSLPSGELVALEGTKLKISKKIINQHNENLRREAVRLHIPRSLVERAEDEEELDEAEADTSTIMEEEEDDDEDDDEAEGSSSGIGRTPSAVKKRPTWMNEDSEYLAGPSKSVQRLRADPKVSFATLLTEIVNELKALEGSEHLLFPVSAKKVKDYYDIVKNPMDLQTVRHKIGEQKYELRATFLMDLKLMVDNSVLYNGQNHVISVTASSMFELASKRLVEKEEHLIRLEKAINPLLDENDRVGFSYILAEIIQKCKNIPKSVPFHTPVDARKTVGYYERISRPMDLGTMERRVKDQYYTSVATFMDDIQQILTNSTLFNGPPEKSLYSKKAEEIVAMAQSHVEMKKAALNELEINMGGRAYEEEYEGENSFPSASENEDDDMDPVREDLAMSEDEDDNNDHRFLDYDESEWQGLLENSTMASAGHVQGDLAMSDSDDESIGAAKRPRLDDDLEEF